MDSSQRFNLVKDYFQSGWAFLIPYLLLYISFWIFGLPVSLLTKISYFLHGLHALALFYLIRRRKLRFDSKNIAFWSTLAVIFFFTGSSLEFPSDPWTHFRRIFLWQTIELIEECSFADKFAYFLGHSLIGWTEPIYRRLAIGLYSSACLLLLACQIYKLSKTLGLNDNLTYIKCSPSSPGATYTVPPQSSVAWPDSCEIAFEQGNAFPITIAAGSGVTVNSSATLVTSGQNSVIALKRVNTDTWTLTGERATT